jgi:hypothetical protein
MSLMFNVVFTSNENFRPLSAKRNSQITKLEHNSWPGHMRNLFAWNYSTDYKPSQPIHFYVVLRYKMHRAFPLCMQLNSFAYFALVAGVSLNMNQYSSHNNFTSSQNIQWRAQSSVRYQSSHTLIYTLPNDHASSLDFTESNGRILSK